MFLSCTRDLIVSRVRSLFSLTILLAASFSLSSCMRFYSSGVGPAGLAGAEVAVPAFFGSVGLLGAAVLLEVEAGAVVAAPVFG